MAALSSIYIGCCFAVAQRRPFLSDLIAAGALIFRAAIFRFYRSGSRNVMAGARVKQQRSESERAFWSERGLRFLRLKASGGVRSAVVVVVAVVPRLRLF